MRLAAIALPALLSVSCSSTTPADPAVALPGSWTCDDGIVLTFLSSGRYEWLVPAGSGVGFASGADDQVKVNPDGSYALLGQWRISGSSLELDMLGETDRYTLSMDSASSLTIDGPEKYSCTKK